jgi:hypothetical protein
LLLPEAPLRTLVRRRLRLPETTGLRRARAAEAEGRRVHRHGRRRDALRLVLLRGRSLAETALRRWLLRGLVRRWLLTESALRRVLLRGWSLTEPALRRGLVLRWRLTESALRRGLVLRWRLTESALRRGLVLRCLLTERRDAGTRAGHEVAVEAEGRTIDGDGRGDAHLLVGRARRGGLGLAGDGARREGGRGSVRGEGRRDRAPVAALRRGGQPERGGVHRDGAGGLDL